MKLIITIEGGMIKEVISEKDKMEITIIDYDSDGVEDEYIRTVEDQKAYITTMFSEVNDERFNNILTQTI